MEENKGKSPNPQTPPLRVDEIAKKKAQETANNQAAANPADEQTDPVTAATNEAVTTGETQEQRMAKAIDAVYKANPDLSSDEIAEIVAKVFKKTESIPAKAAKEAARLITFPDPNADKMVYLKKDKDRKFPIHESALDGIVVRQTYVKKDEEENTFTVPAKNLNEIGIYTQEEFDRLNNAPSNQPGFKRMGVTVEVWHKPGQTGTVQDN